MFILEILFNRKSWFNFFKVPWGIFRNSCCSNGQQHVFQHQQIEQADTFRSIFGGDSAVFACWPEGLRGPGRIREEHDACCVFALCSRGRIETRFDEDRCLRPRKFAGKGEKVRKEASGWTLFFCDFFHRFDENLRRFRLFIWNFLWNAMAPQSRKREEDSHFY